MPFSLHPCTTQDALESTHLVISAYSTNPFRALALPTGFSQPSIDRSISSRTEAVNDPDKFPLKVVDLDTGEIAAYALWTHTKPRSEEDWDRERKEVLGMYPEGRRDVLDELLVREQDMKRRLMGGGRWWELTTLSTLPKYQRRGLGSMLMQWGIDRLEEMRIPGFVIATEQGSGLYLKYGFKEIERWEVDMERWGKEGVYKNIFLVRQPLGHMAA